MEEGERRALLGGQSADAVADTFSQLAYSKPVLKACGMSRVAACQCQGLQATLLTLLRPKPADGAIGGDAANPRSEGAAVAVRPDAAIGA
jgi:hypothetical protein